MNARVLCILALLCGTAWASDPPVWNHPTSDRVVGSAAYFDCQTPSTFTGTSAYMKLWVGGIPVALNHGQNRLSAVIPNPTPGTENVYQVVCQYSPDDVTAIDSLQLNITFGDTAPADNKERANLENVLWSAVAGCGSPCGPVSNPMNNFDSTAGNTVAGTGNSQFVQGTEGTIAFEDEFWFKKRCETVPLPSVWIYDFWVKQTTLPRALEWGVSQVSNGVNYRLAFQANYADPNSPFWTYFVPDGNNPDGSTGAWAARSAMPAGFPPPPTFIGVSGNNGFTHIYFIGHPAGTTVVVDAIQIGEADGNKGTENSAHVIGNTVPAYTMSSNGGCSSPIWNLQSAQIDMDSTDTTDKMWMDQVTYRFQP